MRKGKALRRADCVSGAAFTLLGVLVLSRASQMPMGGTYGGVDNPWYASPAAFPLLLGAFIAALGAVVFCQGAKNAGLPGLGAALIRGLLSLGHGAPRRGSIAVLLLTSYVILLRFPLLGSPASVNYIVSSTAFLAAFALCFHRPRPALRGLTMILAGALAVAWSVAALFSGPLQVPLP